MKIDENKKSKTYINIELLRVISMLMIMFLHYCYQGKVLELTSSVSVEYYIVWILRNFCLIAVNEYILISGFFLSEKQFSWRRIVFLYTQVVFYTIVLSVFCWAVKLEPITLRTFIDVLPVVSRKNWYVTTYLLLLLLTPFLNIAIHSLSRAQLKNGLIVLFIFFSVIPSICFWTDQFGLSHGYSIVWMSYVYCIGAYIRKYELAIAPINALWILLAIIPSFIKFTLERFISHDDNSIIEGVLFGYNFLFVAIPSIIVFMSFLSMRIKAASASTIIKTLGRTSFAVFYMHSFVLLRDHLWIALGSTNHISSLWQIPHALLCIVVVYIICSLIELIRERIFEKTSINRMILELAMLMDRKFKIDET